MNKDVQMVRAEYYFPTINDPKLIFDCIQTRRAEWDFNCQIDNIQRLNNGNTQVDRLLYPCVPGTKAREFIDKKIFFTCGDHGLEGPNGEGKDDIYMWTTSIPSDVCKIDFPFKKQNERAECLIGIMKISKNTNSPGCKVHIISQRDGKLNAYINKTVVWISA